MNRSVQVDVKDFMTDERSKYDTDPLDPDFVRRTEQLSGATRNVQRTPVEQAKTHEGADAPTRLFRDGREHDPHAAPFAPPPPQNYTNVADPFNPPPFGTPTPPASNGATTRMPFAHQPPPPPSARVVPGVGLPENILFVAPYAPLFVGAIAAIVELLLVGRDERRVRFHAAQGLALHGAVLALALLLRVARFIAVLTFGGFVSGLLSVVWLGFFVATIVFFVRAMLRVWNGDEFHIEAADEATRWLDASIKPQK